MLKIIHSQGRKSLILIPHKQTSPWHRTETSPYYDKFVVASHLVTHTNTSLSHDHARDIWTSQGNPTARKCQECLFFHRPSHLSPCKDSIRVILQNLIDIIDTTYRCNACSWSLVPSLWLNNTLESGLLRHVCFCTACFIITSAEEFIYITNQ